MKPRKTRIKVTTMIDGEKKYTPQHKRWFVWYDFGDYEGYAIFEHTNPYSYREHDRTLEGAQYQIREYLRAYERNRVKRIKEDVQSVEYIKYP